MPMFPKLKLTYFNLAARAEAVRLAFYIGDGPFEDCRITKKEMETLKPILPFGQLPVLEVDGEVLAQSQAILRFAGRLANLYPVNDQLAALRCDEILSGVEDAMTAIVPLLREQDPAKRKVLRAELATTIIPRHFQRIEARLIALKDCAVFHEHAVFIHELVIFNYVRWLQSEIIENIPTTIIDAFPVALATVNKIASHAKVKAYYADSRNTPHKLKLTYFGMPGRAEQIRLAFFIGGIEFEDERIMGDQLEQRRASLPFGQLPVLEVNGQEIVQSQQILRFAGIKSGFYPTTDPVAALYLRGVGVARTYVLAGEERVAARKILVEDTIPRLMDAVNKRVAQRGSEYIAGDELSIADLNIYGAIIGLRGGTIDGIPTTIADSFTNLIRVHELVLQHPKVQEWNQKTH